MSSLDRFIDSRLAQGRAFFSKEEAQGALTLTPEALAAALTRMSKQNRLASPRNGFFLILRPEDRSAGAPEPTQWIGPLMRFLNIDYRISLLRAAAFHGSSHQAAMVFQVIVPKQLRDFDIGKHRVQFVYQAPKTFSKVEQPDYLVTMKTQAGFATTAGLELTLLDCARYFHKAAGINGVAQIAKDLGGKANPRRLQDLAKFYENSCVRRLGYLLQFTGHERQAHALEGFVSKSKTYAPIDPAVKPLIEALAEDYEKDHRWKLIINESVEVDF